MNKLSSEHKWTFDIAAKDNHISWRRKFLWTFQAPFSVFVYNVVFFFVYLFIFASVVLSRFCYNPHWLELVLIAWTGTLLIEEARQVSLFSLERHIQFLFKIYYEPGKKDKLKTWFSDLYNKMDALGYVSFFTGVGLKFSDERSSLFSPDDDENCPLRTDGYFFQGHILYSISFIILCLRTMNFYSISRRLGPR